MNNKEPERFIDMGNFRGEHIGRNFYAIMPKTEDQSIDLTGGTDSRLINVPFLHRLVII
jgi:hypothetical protein